MIQLIVDMADIFSKRLLITFYTGYKIYIFWYSGS